MLSSMSSTPYSVSIVLYRSYGQGLRELLKVGPVCCGSQPIETVPNIYGQIPWRHRTCANPSTATRGSIKITSYDSKAVKPPCWVI